RQLQAGRRRRNYRRQPVVRRGSRHHRPWRRSGGLDQWDRRLWRAYLQWLGDQPGQGHERNPHHRPGSPGAAGESGVDTLNRPPQKWLDWAHGTTHAPSSFSGGIMKLVTIVTLAAAPALFAATAFAADLGSEINNAATHAGLAAQAANIDGVHTHMHHA